MINFLIHSISIPQTPPASFRRQVDLHYNSLPRQGHASGAVTSLSNPASIATLNNCIRGGHSGATATNERTDNNANPKQRAVAFGKPFNSLHYSLPYSASKSATNIYHHQMVLYQQPDASSFVASSASLPLGTHGLTQQRGVSVPNLGV